VSELPNGWVHAPLKALLSSDGIFADGDWIESKDQDPNGGIRLLQLADIGDGYFVDKSSRFVNEEKFTALNCTELKTGDVLIARMPAPLGRACLLPEMPQPCITVVDVAVFRTGKEGASNKWLMNIINSPQLRAFMETNSSGTTRKRIARGKLSDMELPIPPLPEQKRIANKLDAVLARMDACRDHLDHIPTILKRFRQSVLAAATSGKLTVDWRIETKIKSGKMAYLGDLGQILAGQSPSVVEVNYEGKGEPYVTGPEQWDGKKILAHKWTEYPKRMAPDGSIFVTVKGAGVGKTFPGCRAAIGRDVYAFVPDSNHDHHFVLLAIQSSVGGIVIKAKGLIPGLTKADIAEHEIYLPVIEEQTEIVRRVESLFAYADRLEARYTTARAQVEKLTPATLAKAFRGELVPQDPNDEPASKLLERIRATSCTESFKLRGRKPKIQNSKS
jgi:type I restriction enzyme S subunit